MCSVRSWHANDRIIEMFCLLNYNVSFPGNEPGKGCAQEKPWSIRKSWKTTVTESGMDGRGWGTPYTGLVS